MLRHFFAYGIVLLILLAGFTARPMVQRHAGQQVAAADSDSVILKYPFRDRINDKYSSHEKESPLYPGDPSNVQSHVEYDPETGYYHINESVGKIFYRNPSYLTYTQFVDQQFKQSTLSYWKQRANEESILQRRALIPKIHVGGEAFDRIFGGNTIDIRPQGSAELIFGYNISRNENPAIPVDRRRISTFDFDEKIQLNVTANIGTKMKFATNYNTEASFDFENKMKIDYTGQEDEIIKKIEAGNVALPLTGSLITGSQTLFGVKTQLQFGRLTMTSVLSQQKGKSSVVEITGGAQTSKFTISADEYEANKHFFLSQYFKDRYDAALSNLPVINSGINVTRVEVWITNKTGVIDNTRNIVAFMDMGEDMSHVYANINVIQSGSNASGYPSNESNNFYQQLTSSYSNARSLYDPILSSSFFQTNNFLVSQDFEKLENARKLSPSEYTVNPKLGYISLNQSLNADEVLSVAYEYTVGNNVFKVGEFATGSVAAPNALFLKLLKGSNLNVRLPLWDLMMKNIYAIGAYQVSNKDFKLDVMYADNATGMQINYLPDGDVKGIPLIKVMGLDRLNTNLDPAPNGDGVFDFVEGVTINSSNGRIMFPVREPFGSYLRSKFSDQAKANNYAFDALYDSTKSSAQQMPELNKFKISGSYQSSSSSEISLNAINIPQGSVSVTAGAVKLTENIDFTVDYTLGRVKIINEGILNSGTPIKIALESNTLFAIQSKTLVGTRLDYFISKDFSLGGTILHLKERPITRKVNIGDEPISNTIWGIDGTYRTESRMLTKLIDRIPFISTKEVSTVTVSGEFAELLPGQPKSIDKNGTAYIDDFEGSKTPIDIKAAGGWFLASTPRGQLLFPEGELFNNLQYGFNRAKLAWYTVDPVFNRPSNLTPDHIKNDVNQLSNHFVREILETEIFPNKETPNGTPLTLPALNLAFYPAERGPYNYDVNGLNPDGSLKNPTSRWGGIMRRVETNDFEAANIEALEFWMMDPFIYDPSHSGGDMYFNIGNVSEDVLRDSRKMFENGLPTTGNATLVDETSWGRVPSTQAIVNVFDNNPDARQYQDVGLDGLRDADEVNFFKAVYIDSILKVLGSGSGAYSNALSDPSGDDYHYFKGKDYDNQTLSILDRYKKYNGVEGNSPTSEQSKALGEDYPTLATNVPDQEDLNRDNTLSESENYYQYHLKLKPSEMQVGKNYITDILTTTVKLKNGNTETVKWYQFKVPLHNPDDVIGNIQDFKSIRFIRLFLRGFAKEIVCRIGKMDLVRSEWRKYNYSLLSPGEYLANDNSKTRFELSAVNIEENGNRSPVPYVLPEGIEREINIGTTNLQKLNEQSLVIKACDLEDGDARAVYRNVQMDVRAYKKLRMYIHAEAGPLGDALNKGDLSVFVRLGSDFTNNYYEYEIPLTPTPSGSKSEGEIWQHADNDLDLDLEKLQLAKQKRNNALLSNPNLTVLMPYTMTDGKNRVTVVGSPNLASLTTIMIGVRNPKRTGADLGDDALPKCGEIWVNELRLTDFDKRGGWAANARVTAKMADLGTLTLVGSKSTYGFGSLDKKVNERSRVDITQYDLSSNLELGKFLPEKTGVKVPMYVGYSESFGTPQYNPTEPDILLKTTLATAENKADKKEIMKSVQDYTLRRSLNFTNVHKNKTDAKTLPHFYDVENFSLTYAYSEIYRRNVTTDHSTAKTYKGALSYNFNNNPKYVTPFSGLPLLGKSKYFGLIKDFNFYYLPSSISFRTDIDRLYSETQLKSNTPLVARVDPTFNKAFTWSRLYDIRFDLTKSLKLDLSATNQARIDEPDGRLDTEEKRDSVRKNFYDLGRTTRYHHTANANYTLPLNKFPLTDWITLTAKYGVDYDWTTAPRGADNLGNTIQNSNTKQLNGNFAMATLYNKVAFLKKINQKGVKKPAPKPSPPKTAIDSAKLKMPVDSVKLKAAADSAKAKKKQEAGMPSLVEHTFRLLMGVKTMSFTYSETNGTLLPGYMPRTYVMGEERKGGALAPGTDFIFGGAQDAIRERAVQHQWITTDTLLNIPFVQTHIKNFSARSNIEPFKGFKIDLNASRNISFNHSEYFRADGNGSFSSYSPIETGNFSISWITWRTAFKKDKKEDHTNAAFENFRQVYRKEMADRLASDHAAKNPQYAPAIDPVTGYPVGYGPTSQNVLIPAFLAAYAGKSPKTVSLSEFPKIPKPNWRITYDGLSKLPLVKQYFNSIMLGHSYRSTYNVNSFTSNLSYHQDLNSQTPDALDAQGNFYPEYEIAQITISEQFAPLFNIDATWKNNILTRFEMKKDRTLSLIFSNSQLTEIRGNEMVMGVGYRLKKFTMPFKIRGKNFKFDNDLNLKADFSVRKNLTTVRRLTDDLNQATAGTRIISVKLSADYVISERLNIKAFMDKTLNKPYVSTAYPTANTFIGISVRFSLSQ